MIDLRARVLTQEALTKSPGEKVVIAGWVYRVRVVGKIAFVIIRDRAGLIQAVVKKNITPEAYNEAIELGKEDVVVVKGAIVVGKSSIGGKEVVVEELEVLARAARPIPIDPDDWDKTGLSKRLDWRFIDLRTPRNALIFHVVDETVNALREFYRSHGFVEVFTPKVVAEATEGGADVFPVIYFDKSAFLAQSPQLYKQMLMAAGFERVFEVGPAYRAEKHHTTRHLTEYESVDIEMSFIESHEDVMEIVERAALYTIRQVEGKLGKKIKELLDIELKPPKSVPRIALTEARRLLEHHGYRLEDPDLGTEGERVLGSIVSREYGTDLFYVTGFPWETRPFYTMRCPENPNYTRSFDLIYKGLEIVSGSQREHRPDVLKAQIKEKGLSVESFEFYLAFFRYGMPPHGGAGLGLERLVMTMLDLKNIREARLLPRDPERLTP